MELLSWAAISALMVSYWFQIYKIQIHKEVRDLSLPYHWLLFIGFSLLGFQAYVENSTIFLVKQIVTSIPVGVLILQIYYHRQDKWFDSEDSDCFSCKRKIEPKWKYCPDCGTRDNGVGNVKGIDI